MADVVTIWNMALGRVGEPYRITDQAEDTAPARAIRTEWDNARRSVLRQGKYNFAVTRAQVSAQAPTSLGYQSPAPYSNRFTLPSGTIRLIELYDASGCLLENYRNESLSVVTNATGPLTIVYVRDVVEVGDWDDLATQALVARLGYAIADTVTGDQTRKDRCWSEFRQLIKDTAAVDSREDPPVAPYDSSWVTARFGSAIGGPPNV